MKLLKFLKSLLPSFEKRQIVEDLAETRAELAETLPPLKAAREFFIKNVFKSKAAIELQKRFIRETGERSSTNFVTAAALMVESIDANLSTIEKLVERYFAEDILKDGMTYVKANLLQYIEIATFSIRFARHLTLWAYQVESHEVNSDVKVTMTRGELKWLEDNLGNFFRVYPILAIKKEELERTIGGIPDALMTEDNIAILGSTVGYKRIDPFEMSLIVGTNWNIIYHFRMAVAEWQVQRHNLAIQERDTMELRLLHLQSLKEGRDDAKLESLINYSELRLQKLKAKILKFEEEANDQ